MIRPAAVTLALVLIFFEFIIAGQSFTTMTYFCTECASGRREVHVRPLGMRSLGTLGRKETPSKYTTLIKAVDSKPCGHRWVFAQGAGGSFL